MAKAALTQEDVQRLLADPSPESRAGAASKIAEEFNAENFGDAEREMAEEIFRLMVKDAEVRVREALAINLKDNPNIPHDVALTLAKDVETVAFPVIQFSEVLSDDDLLGIVASQDETKQLAVAQRAIVSETVSAALVDTQNENVVTALVSNEGAEISDQTFEKVVDTLGDSAAVQEAMVGRTKLPITVTERLVSMVSDNLQSQLVARHELPPAMAADLILQSRERATVTLSSEGDDNDVSDLVIHLHENERLTPSIILRALCMGDFRFFEQALSTLSGLPLISARKLIHDPGGLGLHSIFTKAGLPEPQFIAVKAAIAAARELEYDGIADDRDRYSRRLIELILTQYDELGVEFESDDLDYLLAKVDKLPADFKSDAGGDHEA